MGILMDTLEDTYEQHAQFVETNPEITSTSVAPDSVWKSISFRDCPLCFDRFLSIEELNQHLAERHTSTHVYMRSDSRIIRDLEFFDEKPQELTVILRGANAARVVVRYGEAQIFEASFSGEIILSSALALVESGQITVRIIPEGGEPREFVLFIGEFPVLQHADIDRQAFSLLFHQLNKNAAPLWDDYCVPLLSGIGRELDRRYASGLFEYALGFYLRQQGHESKTHFEDALGLLQPFNTPFSQTAKRVLAFRMNCFGLLRDCSPASRFGIANLFFNQPSSRFTHGIVAAKWGTSEYGVYINHFTEGFLDALNSYYADDYTILEELMKKLDQELDVRDRNDYDKLILLRARAAHKKMDNSAAARFYGELMNHPVFEHEAKEFLDGGTFRRNK